MRSWIVRALAAASVAAAIASGVWWFGTPQTTSYHAPTLTRVDQDSDYYLARHNQPFISTAQYPAAASTAWHARMNDFSGALQMEKLTKSGDTWSSDSWHSLTANGTPLYQLRSPIPVKGQGRKYAYFSPVVSPSLTAYSASTTSVLDPGSANNITVSVLTWQTSRGVDGAARSLFSTHGDYISSTSGISMWLGQDLTAYCRLQIAGGTFDQLMISISAGKPHMLTCVYTRPSPAGVWTIKAYVDSSAVTTLVTSVVGDLSTSVPARIGSWMSGGVGNDVRHGEAAVWDKEVSAADVLAMYRGILSQGGYWSTGSNTLAHYQFDETTTANGLRDHSGNNRHLTVVSGIVIPNYGIPPYPLGTGFARRGVYSPEGDVHYFIGNVAHQTTNDFTVNVWYRHKRRVTNHGYIVGDYQSSNKGWAVMVDATSNKLAVVIEDAGGVTQCVVSDAVVPTDDTEHFYTVRFDRNANATADIDGVAQVATCDISTRQGTIVTSYGMALFRYAGAASNDVEGSLQELLITDGLMTLAEHQAIYRAFRKPVVCDPGIVAPITYTQSTSGWKWPLPPEDGFGVRLSNMAGNSGNPQWPVAYSAQRVNTSNPLGLGFPTNGTVTNVVGYPNEFNSWTATGGPPVPTVVANAAESPDGSWTADRISFTANASGLYKEVVGGGSTVAGERWCFSVKYKRVSGSCTGINVRISSGTAVYSSLTDNLTWATATVCDTTAAVAKRGTFWATTHGSCVLDVADAQYTQNQVYADCTNCTGNVNCVCNPSYHKQDWSTYASLMPASLERGEVTVEWAGEPGVHAADTKQVIWQLGDYASLTAGMQPAFVLKGQGGGPEAVVRAKPLQVLEEGRDYVSSWDLRNGLTNTGPSNWAWDFVSTGNQRVSAANTGLLDLDGYSEATVEVVFTPTNVASANSMTLIGSLLSSANSGWVVYLNSNGLFCRVNTNDVNTYAKYLSAALTSSNYTPHVASCTIRKAGGIWTVGDLYLDGMTGVTGTSSIGSVTTIANSGPVGIGGMSAVGWSMNGREYEVRVSSKAYSAAEILAHYQRSRYQGLAWENDSNTVAHYLLDESTTTDGARDSSGNNNHLTVVTGTPTARYNTLSWPDGQRQYAGLSTAAKERTNWGWDFESTDSEDVRAASPSTLSVGSNSSWSVESIVRFESWPGVATYGTVFGSSREVSKVGYGLEVQNSGVITCLLSNGDGTHRHWATSNALSLNTLYHIVCVYNRVAGTWQTPVLYVNGAVNVAGTGGSAPTTEIGTNTQAVRVGQDLANAASYLDGTVYEVAVHNKAFSAAEIYERYNNYTLKGLNWPNDSNTLAHYLMDETSSSSGLRDSSGNNNHLTVVTGTPDPHYETLPYVNVQQTFAYYQPAAMWSRNVTSTVDAIEPPSQRDLNAYILSVGCDLNGQNCSNGLVSNIEVSARPAQAVRGSEVDLAYMADMTGPSWLARAAAPDLCDFDFGVASSNRWCWNTAEYSGSLYDQVNGAALAPTGTPPAYQVPSGLLARGQGRRGVRFDGSPEKISASSTSVLEIGSRTSWAAHVLMDGTSPVSWRGIFGVPTVNPATTLNQYALWVSSAQNVFCSIADSVNAGYYGPVVASNYNGQPKLLSCLFKKVAGTWTINTCIDGVCYTGMSGTAPTGNITNGSAVAVSPGEPAYHNGSIYEVLVSTNAETTAPLALYKRTTQTGKYWLDDTSTVAHFKMNESTITNGVGLKDHSGNNNHLTVVTGNPDPQYRDMPWPAGSGVARPAIDYTTTGAAIYHGATDATVANPTHQQPITFVTIIRAFPSAPNQLWFLGKNYPTSPGYLVYTLGTGEPMITWRTSDGDTSRQATTRIHDGRWHLVTGKVIWDGDSWNCCISVDGSAFTCADSAKTGDPSGNTGMFRIGQMVAYAHSSQIAGAAVWKNYALTDANVSQLWAAIKGPLQAEHAYARTSTYAKGVCYDVANDPVDGMRVHCSGNNEVPYAYSSDLIGLPGNERTGLGLPVSATFTNINAYSEEFDNPAVYQPVRVTVAANYTYGPDGTKTAESVTENDELGQHHLTRSLTVTAVPHTTVLYAKKGSRWGIYFLIDSGVTGAYINLGTCTVGQLTGAPTVETKGAGGGWCRIRLTSTPTAGVRSWYIFLASEDGIGGYQGNSVAYPNGVYLGSMGVYVTGSDPIAYCPTDASSQTCNTPTANYVPAAALASWSHKEGVLASVAKHSAQSIMADLYASSLINRIYTGSGGSCAIYDNASVLQQVISVVSSPPLAGNVLMYDSQEPWYQTTRRATSTQYSTSYMGPGTNTTDLNANWTYGGGTNMWLGELQNGTFLVDIFGNVYIYNQR